MESVCYLCGGTKHIQNYTGELYDCPECEQRPIMAVMLDDLSTANAALDAQSERIKALEYTLRLIANNASSGLIQAMAKTALGESPAPASDTPSEAAPVDAPKVDCHYCDVTGEDDGLECPYCDGTGLE